MDEELAAWRRRPLGEIHYLFLDARYEKLRDGGVVRDAALFSAIGIGPDGQRRVLGVSCDPSEAEIHWRAFLDSLIDRGMRGVRFVVSDDHAGLKAARRRPARGHLAALPVPPRAVLATHHAPNAAIRKRIGVELRRIWNASSLQTAQEELDRLVTAYRGAADRLADWLEHNVPEGLAVFTLPEQHWRRMRTANPIERAIQQEIKRRTSKVRVFPNRDALLRLAVLLSSSKSTRTGQPQTASTSTGTARMPDRPNSESPDFRLLNPSASSVSAVICATKPWMGLRRLVLPKSREFLGTVRHVSVFERGH